MAEITLKFPDGSSKTFKKGITGKEVIKELPQSIRKSALAVKTNENVLGLSQPIEDSGDFLVLTFDDDEGKNVFWHSSAHVLATAIHHLFPKALPAIGPAIKEGFYYDFYNLKLSSENFPRIEKEIKKILQQNFEFQRKEISKENALEIFKKNKFKIELIQQLKKPSTYTDGDFTDLCRGPHLLSTGVIKALKLTKVSGAYWKADSKRDTANDQEILSGNCIFCLSFARR